VRPSLLHCFGRNACILVNQQNIGLQIAMLSTQQQPPLWSSRQRVPATDPEVPCSISCATRFSEK
jgi:hypothetical protein